MSRLLEVPRDVVTAIREGLLSVTRQSERTVLLGTILLASAVSAAASYLLIQCFSVDVLSSLLFIPQDCSLNWGMNIGRHCFGDYPMIVDAGMRPDPWVYQILLPSENQARGIQYPAAAMLPQLLFGAPAKWLGVPPLGLVGYLFTLTIAVLAPAIWAARGARGLERVVVFVALGAAAIPAWAVIDRGNSVGFEVPIALVFLVSLCRRRWRIVAIMVVLAALVKPQFVGLAVALLAARQWRLGGLAIAGAGLSNLAAYLLWPQHFPETITHSIHNLFFASGSSSAGLVTSRNVSFGRALLLIPDIVKMSQTGGEIPDDFLAGPRSWIGYAILVLVVAAVLALGRRISPVMVGVVMLATVPLSTPNAFYYYLVFVLPVAALVVRDPDGPPGTGIFDRLATHGDRRRAVGVCVSVAAALSIAQVAVPSQPVPVPIPAQLGASGVIGTALAVPTTAGLVPFLWLVACAVIIVSYARRPAHSHDSDQGTAQEDPHDTDVSSSDESGLLTESSSQRLA